MQSGRVAVYGDSNCLDSSHQRSSCYNLLIKLIQYAAEVTVSQPPVLLMWFIVAVTLLSLLCYCLCHRPFCCVCHCHHCCHLVMVMVMVMVIVIVTIIVHTFETLILCKRNLLLLPHSVVIQPLITTSLCLSVRSISCMLIICTSASFLTWRSLVLILLQQQYITRSISPLSNLEHCSSCCVILS